MSFVLKSVVVLCIVQQGIESCCTQERQSPPNFAKRMGDVELIVLGIAQDAGFPQIGCEKACCVDVWDNPAAWQPPTALAIVDHRVNRCWLIEATPQIGKQLHQLNSRFVAGPATLAGVFVTHAHIGHYSGLMYLGREVMGANRIPVFAMPRMANFLRTNGPWSQLVKLHNIQLRGLEAGRDVALPCEVRIRPFTVPHRDEYSETVGFRIDAQDSKILFIPDIDKWSRWNQSLQEQVAEVDVALLDATFFGPGELPGRNMDEIPHPFVVETMELARDWSDQQKAKVRLIHFNHTNPLLDATSPQSQAIRAYGMHTSRVGERFVLRKKKWLSAAQPLGISFDLLNASVF